MKRLVFLSLAAFASSTIAFAQTTDTAAYKAAHERAESDYKVAKDKCGSLKYNAKDVCKEEAKVALARADLDAINTHMRVQRDIDKAQRKLADAEYDLAKERCDDQSGAAKSSCISQARSTRDTSLASYGKGATMAETARDTTGQVADAAREKTADASIAMSDTMITTKVKAEMAADPLVKAMDVHVETQKGVVMLSGFVPSKAEADKAVDLARHVKGVTEVKSSLQIKK